MPICLASACTSFAAMDSRVIATTDIGLASDIAGASCARCSSISLCTSSVSRCDSLVMRPAKYRTASGSSAASVIVSASSEIAPDGVFSSWDTFVMKSRRIASNRRCSLISRRKIANRSSAIAPMRTRRYNVSVGTASPARTPRPSCLRSGRGSVTFSSRSRTWPSATTSASTSPMSSATSRPLRTRFSGSAPLLA